MNSDPLLPSKKFLGFGQIRQDSDYFNKFRGKSFIEYNSMIGLPVKNGRTIPMLDYELEAFSAIQTKKLVWIKKATGLGITEFMLRWITWRCVHDDRWRGYHVIIITGPRIELAITLMDRLKRLFKDYTFTSKNTYVEINGVQIECFPSHHLDAARGLNPQCIFLDEADFFPPNEQDNARVIAERYLAKNDPYIVMVSTPSPDTNGLFSRMEREEPSIYHRMFFGYQRGVGTIFTEREINLAKQSPTFEQEYNLQYGYGEGNIFPIYSLQKCTVDYSLKPQHGQKVLCIDPAYGSSYFGIVGFEKLDGIPHVMEAVQFERASPAAMLEIVTQKAENYNRNVLVDGAHPGLIRDLKERGISAQAVNFNKELSNMVTESSQAVKEERVRIHPSFTDLLGQLRSVKFDDKGKPNKKEISFDLGDAFMMGCNHLKYSHVIIKSA